MKRKILTATFILFLLFFGCIHIVNNHIAEKIRQDLLAIPLLPQTKIIDSKGISGKLFGNGNGMQYTGVILVDSELDGDYLGEHYKMYYPDCEIISSESKNYNVFFSIKKDEGQLYVIYLTKQIETGTIPNSFFYRLLSLDLRGH